MKHLRTTFALLAAAALGLAACAPAAMPTQPAAAAEPKQWSTPPEMTIDINKSYTTTIETSKRNNVTELLPLESHSFDHSCSEIVWRVLKHGSDIFCTQGLRPFSHSQLFFYFSKNRCAG